ncbi:hypothetical protein VTN96DRAFT_6229 [Rasamsonia emersonii]
MMDGNHSGVTWFDEDRWIGSEVTFGEPHPSRWRLNRKLAESEDCATESDVKECMMASEARGVFVCSSIDDPTQEAVVKIRMQIPYFSTAFKSRQARARQAEPDMRVTSQREVSALEHLTAVGCSSTPALFAWKHETQGDDDWIPGGYIDYILMEKLPGTSPGYWSGVMKREERDQLRRAFKEAWQECVACGRVHQDRGIRNLVWDREKQKCYIVDWEEWSEATDEDVWRDTQYIAWNLAWVRSHNYNDMSTWTL